MGYIFHILVEGYPDTTTQEPAGTGRNEFRLFQIMNFGWLTMNTPAR